jgi:histidinol dehydrogenase
VIEVIRSHDTTRRRLKLKVIKERNVALDAELMATVAAIIDDVRRHGDAALVDYTARFDGVRLRREDLRVGESALRESAARVDGHVLEALREAIKRVRDFHDQERVKSWEIDGARGVRLGQRVTPIESAGLYVPGGTASYPSSVVMNVTPAQVAGVGRLAVVTPPKTLAETPAVAAALLELGITEIYQVGGAQAVAALAYGTETIPRVHKITGPGNKYVAAAKKLVLGDSTRGRNRARRLRRRRSSRAGRAWHGRFGGAHHDERHSGRRGLRGSGKANGDAPASRGNRPLARRLRRDYRDE